MIEALSHLALDHLKRSHPSCRSVEFGGKPGPIRVDGVELSGQAHFALCRLMSALNCSRKGFQRERKSPTGCFDSVWVDHEGKYTPISSALRRRN
jgi:hypothetical protein